MRELDLRRLFRRIAATAAPLPLAFGASACGGTVSDSSHRGDTSAESGGIGGAPSLMGRVAAGTGGVPMFNGFGVPEGGGAFNVGGTGGVPMFIGLVGPPSTGGVPVFTGVADASPPPVLDAGSRPFCGDQPLFGCASSYCVPMASIGRDAGSHVTDGGVIGQAECSAFCTGNVAFPCTTLTYEGTRYVKCQPLCTVVGGRRPEGLVAAAPSRTNHLAKYFEDMTRLEAASIPAFRILRRELALHGASKKLLRSARAAARDEIRHARAARALARRFGGRYVAPVIQVKPTRSIEAIAIENAVEGCVRETFGAMMATWQAKTAADPAIRKVMHRIALDETRHAALALRVAAWAERRLDDAARGRVRAARREAVAAVLGELDYEVPEELASVAGVPSGRQARLMAEALDEQLWGASVA
jgi:hypothetical protein